MLTASSFTKPNHTWIFRSLTFTYSGRMPFRSKGLLFAVRSFGRLRRLSRLLHYGRMNDLLTEGGQAPVSKRYKVEACICEVIPTVPLTSKFFALNKVISAGASKVTSLLLNTSSDDEGDRLLSDFVSIFNFVSSDWHEV